jgi:hypothetical protein
MLLCASKSAHLTRDICTEPRSIVVISVQKSAARSLETLTETTDRATACHQKSNRSLTGTSSSRNTEGITVAPHSERSAGCRATAPGPRA